MHIFLYCSVNQFSEQNKIKFYKTLIRLVAIYGAEFWTLNKDTHEPSFAFERKVLEGCSGEII
jgi:hypothetical protein